MTSTAAEAVQALIKGQPPSYTFLLRNIFRVLVSRSITTATEIDYYAVDFQGMLRFQAGPDGSTYAKIRSFLVPVTPGRTVFTSGHFPTRSFSTINLATSGLRPICTEQLTGCTMAFGWDATNRRLHVGHVEPDDTIPEISDRMKLCHYLRTSAKFTGFEGVTLPKDHLLFVGGDRPCWSDYYGDKANVIGFLHNNTIRLVVQVVKPDGREIRERWTLDFPF